jgi:AcrR family transcriptional regulator
MAPRPYNSAIRKDAEAETIRRIVAATIQLHAEKGTMATSHADIAERAGVSVPTVYKYFPTRNSLLPACMGEVSKAAPEIDPAEIMAAPDIGTRLHRLTQAVYDRYRYFNPWIRWTAVDAPFMPEIAEAATAGQQQLEMLVRAVLADSVAKKIPEDVLALVLVLLDYPAWQRLNQLLAAPGDVSRAAVHALQLIVLPFYESE